MDKSIKECIKSRRSVRTYDGKQLSEEDKLKLNECAKEADNPFGVPVEFRFLEAKDHNLTSPVIVGCDYYVAIKASRNSSQWEIACGYSFEKFCLDALKSDFGTVILAGTFSRDTFEQAMELKEDEVMPVASPVGRIADKMSIREKLMRKGVGADKRLPFEDIFFDESFDKGLTPERAGKFYEALEMVRLAPSAVNKQPWRVVVCGDSVHFYEKHNKSLENELGDIQKIDMGIALAHFDLTLKEEGYSGTFVAEKPNINDDSLEYIITYKL